MTKLLLSRPVETLLTGLLVALPVVLFALVWNYYAVDVPKWDDHALRSFLHYAGQEPSLSGKLYYLIRQHNEHRIVYDRVVAALDYGLFGKLNYRHLMVVGNLSLVGLLVLFGGVLHQAKLVRYWLLYLVPVALFLFNLSQWENMFWGMAALQNFTVVLWVLLAIYLLALNQNRTSYLNGALVAGVLATLTSGNGMLIWPIGVGILVLQQQWSSLRRWAVSAVTVLVLYFVGYEKPAGNPPSRGSVIDLLTGWLAFNGSAGEVFPVGQVFENSLIAGSLVTAVALAALFVALRPPLIRLTRLARSTYRYRSSQNRTAIAPTDHLDGWPVQPETPTAQTGAVALQDLDVAKATGKPTVTEPVSPATYFFIGSVLFLLGTGVLVAWARVGFGLELLITSRYKMYSLTLLVVIYVYLISALPRRTSRWVGLLGGVGGLALAWLSYYSFLDETIWWRHWMLTSQFNWTYTTNRPVALTDSISARYSRPAAAFYDPILPRLYGPPQPPVQLLDVEETETAFTVREPSLASVNLRDGRSYVMARAAGPKGRVYLFPVWQSVRLGRASRFLPWNSAGVGFVATLLKRELAAGTYNLLVLSATPDGGWVLHPTNQIIHSLGEPGVDIQKNW